MKNITQFDYKYDKKLIKFQCNIEILSAFLANFLLFFLIQHTLSIWQFQ